MRKTTEKTPEVYMLPKGDGNVRLIIRNAGIAGNLLQFKIVKDKIEFVRVVPPNCFVGTYNDPGIAKGEKAAIKKGKHAFITNTILTTESDAKDLTKIIEKMFPVIWKIVNSDNFVIRRERKRKVK